MAGELNVSIKVCERPYLLKAASPEMEELIRKAADIINKKVNSLRNSYPGKTETDLLTFVALNICISELGLRQKYADARNEVQNLASDLESYLEGLE